MPNKFMQDSPSKNSEAEKGAFCSGGPIDRYSNRGNVPRFELTGCTRGFQAVLLGGFLAAAVKRIRVFRWHQVWSGYVESRYITPFRSLSSWVVLMRQGNGNGGEEKAEEDCI